MKKNGFVAISLIYSFFLAFIALMVVVLANFIANNIVLKRYNENVAEYLNNQNFIPTITAKNSFIMVNKGESNVIIDTYFTISNATESTCLDEDEVVTNTSTLAMGTHTIVCTAKNKGRTSSASIDIVIK